MSYEYTWSYHGVDADEAVIMCAVVFLNPALESLITLLGGAIKMPKLAICRSRMIEAALVLL